MSDLKRVLMERDEITSDEADDLINAVIGSTCFKKRSIPSSFFPVARQKKHHSLQTGSQKVSDIVYRNLHTIQGLQHHFDSCPVPLLASRQGF